MTRTAFQLIIVLSFVALSGCASSGNVRRSAESFGKTFYLDGAGNWGFGAASVPNGLKEAGYNGDVEIYVWTTSFVPLIDQLNIVGAKIRAAALTDRIKRYRNQYPDNPLNVIALSAGTGVAIWAVEGLDTDTKINNLVLLGSSLSHDYDARNALENMDGKIYVYHSPHDLVLEGVTVIGTIDGKKGVQSAGLVGLRKPPGTENRIVNIPWSKQYMRYGWTGAHTDCTNQPFIRSVVAKHVLNTRDTSEQAQPPQVLDVRIAYAAPRAVGP